MITIKNKLYFKLNMINTMILVIICSDLIFFFSGKEVYSQPAEYIHPTVVLYVSTFSINFYSSNFSEIQINLMLLIQDKHFFLEKRITRFNHYFYS